MTPTDGRREQARVEAEIALRRRPGLAEAREALATYWILKGEVANAIEELGLALDAFPNSADLRVALGKALAQAGRFNEAVAEFDHATRLEPGNLSAALEAATTYNWLRRREEAMRAFDHAIALAPEDHTIKMIKGQAYLRWKGIADTLAAAMERIPPDWDPDEHGYVCPLHRILGPAPIRRRGRHAGPIPERAQPRRVPCISRHR